MRTPEPAGEEPPARTSGEEPAGEEPAGAEPGGRSAPAGPGPRRRAREPEVAAEGVRRRALEAEEAAAELASRVQELEQDLAVAQRDAERLTGASVRTRADRGGWPSSGPTPSRRCAATSPASSPRARLRATGSARCSATSPPPRSGSAGSSESCARPGGAGTRPSRSPPRRWPPASAPSWQRRADAVATGRCVRRPSASAERDRLRLEHELIVARSTHREQRVSGRAGPAWLAPPPPASAARRAVRLRPPGAAALAAALRHELAARAAAEGALRARLVDAEARLAARVLIERRTAGILAQLRAELDGLRAAFARERDARLGAERRAAELSADVSGGQAALPAGLRRDRRPARGARGAAPWVAIRRRALDRPAGCSERRSAGWPSAAAGAGVRVRAPPRRVLRAPSGGRAGGRAGPAQRRPPAAARGGRASGAGRGRGRRGRGRRGPGGSRGARGPAEPPARGWSRCGASWPGRTRGPRAGCWSSCCRPSARRPRSGSLRPRVREPTGLRPRDRGRRGARAGPRTGAEDRPARSTSRSSATRRRSRGC